MIKKLLKNEKAFTMVEMMIVLLVITVILLVALPNVTNNSSAINEKGCKAYIQMIQGQVEAYRMEEGKVPKLSELKTYLGKQETDELVCPNGDVIEINGDGKVTEVNKTP